MSDGFWRGVFLSAGITNFIVGAALAFDTSDMAAAIGVETLRYDPLYSPLVGCFIILFGMLYLAVWRDLENRAIVAVSVIGKLAAFALSIWAWTRGLAPGSIAALSGVDAVYAALFAWYLASRGRR